MASSEDLFQISVDYRVISDMVPEEEKNKLPYLVGNGARHIADLYFGERIKERDCYNFYNGIRDDSEYRHLVDNYGIGQPIDFPFLPVMGKESRGWRINPFKPTWTSTTSLAKTGKELSIR
jgi:hypothetical protein